MGLPPSDPERRHEWLKGLEDATNLGAFVEGKLAGHLALIPGNRMAEMCCFVHQDFRRRGVAMALGRTAVEECHKAGIAAMWVLIDSGNLSARNGLLKFGFHAAWEDLREGQYVLPIRKAEAAA
jgi:GNAT superfamily N-acetyltransferase